MYSELESSDIVDVPDNGECDFTEVSDSESEVDDMLNDMSLDELYELRDSLTEEDETDTENEFPDVSDMMPLEEEDTSDYSLVSDSESEVDDMLNDMSLEELYELRDSLTEGDASDAESDTENEFPDVSDMMPLEDEETSDYSFHWDGGPTHNTDWDEEPEPAEYTKKLTR